MQGIFSIAGDIMLICGQISTVFSKDKRERGDVVGIYRGAS